MSFRKAVVTGAGSGLGRALALELGRRGADVVVADVDAEAAARTADEVAALGVRGVPVRVDVTRAEEVEALLEAARAALGHVDLWVNNAGVAVGDAVGAASLDDWRWVVGVNFWGVVHGCHVAVPYLRGRGAGHVLNVASAAGLVSMPRMGPYNTTKAAVVSLSQTLYGELSGTGVGVTVLCPTFFTTNLLATARGDAQQMRIAAKLMRRSKVQADDVARRALDDAARGRLYSVPMTDGRVMWALARLLPQRFYDLVPKGLPRVLGRVGAEKPSQA